MAAPIAIPDCALKLLEFLYPTVDWGQVTFFSGLPWWVSGGTLAITIPNPSGLWGYRIYLGNNTDFCQPDTLATLVHEGFHIQQFTGIAGGYGVGFVRPGFFKYFVCVFAAGYQDTPYETEAYAQELAFKQCHNLLVCDCTTGEPVFNPDALEALQICNEKLIVHEARVPSCGKWWSFLLALALVPLIAILAFLGHLFEFLSCKYLEVQSQACATWGTTTRKECSQWADQGHAQCTQWADEGYSTCSDWADQGHNACCTWWPCSWACNAFVWISHWVCVATVWISHLVCRATIWIVNLVCLVWTYFVELTCRLWTTVLRTILLCWWR